MTATTTIIELKQNIESITVNTFRYKFTQDIMDLLYEFSKIHQYDDRKIFKDAWEIFVAENTDVLEDEISRLKRNGYDGDILEKMFKSARYYFRKKNMTTPEPKKRKQYVGISKEILNAIDTQILVELQTNSNAFKPSNGFDNFCSNELKNYKAALVLMSANNLTAKEIMEKIKKTYKNRYFTLISK